ncbi:MAG: hypothetical protein ABSD73_02590 [Candidatus Bathyarchaeia archaeon]|jgi:hypothetical protein
MKKEVKAISTLFAILLILLAAIIGALIAYTWTIAPFYREPENTLDLIVTGANFPVNDANHFNVTVLNPSHSIADANITTIYVTAGGFNATSITSSQPALPLIVARGTSQTVTCSLAWGSLAGSLIAVHVLTANDTEAALLVQTQQVSLGVDASFDASKSAEYFNMTVTNQPSAINLTLSDVLLNYNPVDANLSIKLPTVIPANQTITFTCYENWQELVQAVVTVQTQEGYTAQITQNISSISLQVTQVTFNETNTDEADITLFNSPDSATSVIVTNITLAYGSTMDVISGNLSNPSLPMAINQNQTFVFACAWNWTSISYRNMDVTVTAYTEEGFVSQTQTATTPLEVAAKINNVVFDLKNTGLFLINMTNMPYSLNTVNVTRVDLNQNQTSTTATLIAAGAQSTLTCVFNWSSFVGQNVTVTAYVMNASVSQLTYNLMLPYLEITNASFFNLSPGSPYLNVTVYNSEFSKINATVTQMNTETENGTMLITWQSTGGAGQQISIGSAVGMLFPWKWEPYVGQNVTITIQTADGYQTSATFTVG